MAQNLQRKRSGSSETATERAARLSARIGGRYTGYMQPLTAITPQLLVKEQILPQSLMSTTVVPRDFRLGIGELQLPVDADALWQQAWLAATNGI